MYQLWNGNLFSVWKGDRAAGHLCELTFQIADLFEQSIDARLQLLLATLALAWSGLSAHILCAEAIDVALVLAMDQIEQILVIEALALAGLVADDSIVVQIDAHVLAVRVLKSVEDFCFARFFS